MQQASHPYAFRTVETPCEPSFKLFIACEDNAAFFQARKVEDQVRVLCGDEIDVSRVFWSFSLLRQAQLQAHAVKEADEAQLLIVSLSERTELPPHVKAVLDSLPVRATPGQAALVALIGYKEGLFSEPPPALPYLRQLAEGRGLDFFCNQSGWDRLDISKPAGHSASPARAAAPANIISHRIPWRSGGINE